MKPYLVYKTWIDLDHVVAIDSDSLSPGCGGSDHVRVEFLFKNGPVFIDVGPAPDAQRVCAFLIEAWKAKDLYACVSGGGGLPGGCAGPYEVTGRSTAGSAGFPTDSKIDVKRED